MKEPRWGNDPESQAFLLEAEGLLQGVFVDGKMRLADP